ncbi:MAG: amino acid permease [Sedimentisphaerales bacterium]|nr:amino acid permease [Sedimentisphaerales bacterium]
MNTPKEKPQPTRSNQLGTFGGVFTPSILTILGVIMFMRTGFLTGQAGVMQLLIILVMAKSITSLTSLSISAVSTNTPVAGGGAYFLISRSLGPEFGATIGLALFVAQAISVPFYILGFTEALVRTFPSMMGNFQTVALILTVLLFVISYIGAKWAVKTQYLIMAILGLSVLALLGGAAMNFQTENFIQNFSAQHTDRTLSFWTVFAIFFPAVTGIMAGVNMSGDLKKPGRSIPRGTMAAVVVGFLIYASQILLIGGAQTRSQLLNNSFENFCNQALFGAGFLVVAGVFAATFSSALGSFLGAPRVLQAIARDKILRPLNFFARGSKQGDEPHRALLLTFIMTVAIIFWAGKDFQGGAFDLLAAVVAMFFLYTYGMINLAAFIESVANNPSFRPRFKYCHWSFALLGAVGCATTAFLINIVAAIVAAAVLAVLYVYLRRRVLKVRFGDARWGFFYSGLKQNILRLARMPITAKNWRPTVLVLVGSPEARRTIAMHALWIGQERGLVILARVIVGELAERAQLRQTAVDQLNDFLEENQFQALSTVVISPDLDEGLSVLLQGHPVGPLQPNIVMLGWSSDSQRFTSLVEHFHTIRLLGLNLVLVNDKGLPTNRLNRRIDIWWRGRENGFLMVLLAHLITLNYEWSDAKIRLLRLIENEQGRQPAAEALTELVNDARVNAEVQIIVSEDPFQGVVHRHSANASLVILGFNTPKEQAPRLFQDTFEAILDQLPTTLLVCSAGEADLLA